MNISKIKLLALTLLSLLSANFAFAGDGLTNKIAVIVNDQIITHRDINNRISILTAFNMIPPGVPQGQILPLVKAQMVGDALIASHLGSRGRISNEEINSYIAGLEEAQKFPQGYFKKFIAHNKLSMSAFESLLKSTMVRGRVSAMLQSEAKPTFSEVWALLNKAPQKNLPIVNGVMINYPPTMQNKVLTQLNQNLPIPELKQRLSKIAGVEVKDINKPLIELENNPGSMNVQSILASLRPGEYSMPIDLKRYKSIVVLNEVDMNLPNQVTNQLMNMLVSNKGAQKLERFLADLYNNSVILYK